MGHAHWAWVLVELNQQHWTGLLQILLAQPSFLLHCMSAQFTAADTLAM